jgi:hypothetical protein
MFTQSRSTTLRAPRHVRQAKCTLGSETRLVQLSGISTYAELMHSVRAKFPSAGHFQLKFLDRRAPLELPGCWCSREGADHTHSGLFFYMHP